MNHFAPPTIIDLTELETEIEEQIKRLPEGSGPLYEFRLTILQDGLARCQQRRAELEQELSCQPKS
jgi:hypothetical protein